MRILMVCLGNICRSPLAEGILKAKVKQAGLNWEIDSAGTGAWHVGELPDSRSIDIASQHNIDITDQRARQIKSSDISYFDLIYVMDRKNYENVLRLVTKKEQKDKIRFMMDSSRPGEQFDVPDPYYLGLEGFSQVYTMLDEACTRIIDQNR